MDLTAEFGIDSATAWQVSTSDIEGVFVLAQIGDTVASFQFQTTLGTDTSALGNPLDAALYGVEKIASI
jgi:hypothetical protein